jgi:hypothetical protein
VLRFNCWCPSHNVVPLLTLQLVAIIVFAITLVSVSKGNGNSIQFISPSDLVKVQQIQYAVDLLYIFVLFGSRASVILLIARLQDASWKLQWKVTVAILGVWAIASLFMIALKCDLHYPWLEYGNVQCTGLVRPPLIRLSLDSADSCSLHAGSP